MDPHHRILSDALISISMSILFPLTTQKIEKNKKIMHYTRNKLLLNKREQWRKSEIFKGSRELLICYPPTTLGGLQLCGEKKQKSAVALLAGKTTAKFELSLVGLIVSLNIDRVIWRVKLSLKRK